MPDAKILLIDDDRIFVTLISALLNKENYEVVTAVNGAEGMAMVSKQKPDVIILDVLMPAMTGYDFIQKMHETGILKDTPVIAMSARESMKEFFHSWEIYGFLKKPADPQDLLKMVRAALDSVKIAKAALSRENHDDSGGLSAAGKTAPKVSVLKPSSEPPPTAEEEGAPLLKKSVLLIGTDEYMVTNVKKFLDRKGAAANTALGLNGAVEKTEKASPDFVFVQYCQDHDRLDVKKVIKKVDSLITDKKAPFVVFCHESLEREARKFLKEEEILTYATTDELQEKIFRIIRSS